MQGGSKKVELKRKYSTFKVIEKLHPHKMMMYLALFGSFLILSFMVFAFAISKSTTPIETTFSFPKIFTFNTFLLLMIGFFVNKTIPLFGTASHSNMKDSFAAILGMLIIFSVCQVMGWMELQTIGFYEIGESTVNFLKVITIFHLLFTMGGIVLVVTFLFKTWRLLHDPVKSLISETNPYEKIKLDMFATYWYSYNLFWLLTFFYFFFSY